MTCCCNAAVEPGGIAGGVVAACFEVAFVVVPALAACGSAGASFAAVETRTAAGHLHRPLRRSCRLMVGQHPGPTGWPPAAAAVAVSEVSVQPAGEAAPRKVERHPRMTLPETLLLVWSG